MEGVFMAPREIPLFGGAKLWLEAPLVGAACSKETHWTLEAWGEELMQVFLDPKSGFALLLLWERFVGEPGREEKGEGGGGLILEIFFAAKS